MPWPPPGLVYERASDPQAQSEAPGSRHSIGSMQSLCQPRQCTGLEIDLILYRYARCAWQVSEIGLWSTFFRRSVHVAGDPFLSAGAERRAQVRRWRELVVSSTSHVRSAPTNGRFKEPRVCLRRVERGPFGQCGFFGTPRGLGLATATTSVTFFPHCGIAAGSPALPTSPSAPRSSRAPPARCAGCPAWAGDAHEEVTETIIKPLDVRQQAHGRMVLICMHDRPCST